MTTLPRPRAPADARPAEVFVGRRRELAALAAAWDDARRGVARVVAVEGGAGVGKTALIADVVARAGAGPGAVVTVTADETEVGLRYGVIDQLGAALPSDVVARSGPLRIGRDAGGADPWAVGTELLAALDAITRPLLLVLDDVGWADDASTRALVFALRRSHHSHLLVLLGVRDGADDAVPAPPVDPAWDRLLAAHPGATRLRLAGLDPAELSELAVAVGRPLGSTTAAHRLWAHTHGHPLYARTLLAELPPAVLAGTDDVLPAPRSLAAVVLVRLARASTSAQALVVAAAVLGERCALHHAGAVARLPDPVPALSEAVGLGLLTEGPGASVRFVHPLLRAAVYRDLPPARRRDVHLRAAQALDHAGDDGEALRHRVDAATGPDPVLAAALAARAAALAGPGAADLLRRAADLADGPDDRERFLLDAADRLLADGEVGRVAAMEPELERLRPGARRSTVLGQLAVITGRFDRARARLEGVDAPAAAAALGLLAVLEGDPDRALRLAGPTLAVPDAGPAVRVPAGAAVVLGLAASGLGEQARAVLDHAGARPGVAGAADALVVRGLLAALAGDDPAAAENLDAAVDRARTGQPVRALALGLAFRAVVHDRLGDAGTGGHDGDRDPVEALESAIALARDGGTVLAHGLAAALAAEALARRGRLDEARAHLRTARADGPLWWGGEVCLATAGAVLVEEGDDPDPRSVLRALAPALRPEVRALTDGFGELGPRVLEVDALLGLGRQEEAAVALAGLESLLDPPGRTGPTRFAVDAARLRLAVGDAPLPRGIAALGLADVVAPFAVARLETELGRRWLEAGERRLGVDLLRSARDRFAHLGAPGRQRRCEEMLHAAGLTPSGPRGALGLTEHEEAVVALVARGLTNREVGAALFITPRTVAYHLSNVYAKLGVTSRRQLQELAAAR